MLLSSKDKLHPTSISLDIFKVPISGPFLTDKQMICHDDFGM